MSEQYLPTLIMCIWHVLKNWSEHGTYKSMNKELQDSVMLSLRTLLHTEDRHNIEHVCLKFELSTFHIIIIL